MGRRRVWPVCGVMAGIVSVRTRIAVYGKAGTRVPHHEGDNAEWLS